MHRFSSALSPSKKVRGPGIEPGSTAWKATMLTITPATLETRDLEGAAALTHAGPKCSALHPAGFEPARTMSTGA
jgi:hypothetical protein